MKNNELHQQILKKLDELDQKVDGVRTQDIPSIKTDIAGFHGKIKALEDKTKWSTRLYTILGGAIAVAISKYTGHQ